MTDGAGLRYVNKTNGKTLVRRHSQAAEKMEKNLSRLRKRNGKIPNSNKQRCPD